MPNGSTRVSGRGVRGGWRELVPLLAAAGVSVAGAWGCARSAAEPGSGAEPAGAEEGVTADDCLARWRREYPLPSPSEPGLGGLSDLHTPERMSRERVLLASYERVPSPRTAGLLGAIYAQAEECNRAMGWLVRSLEGESGQAESWFWLGVCRYFLARPEEARLCLLRSRELGGRSAQLERFLGEADLQLGRPERAESAFRAALELDPNAWHARLNLALLEEDNGDLTEAVRHLETLARLDPDHPTPHFRLARIYRRLGRTEAAEEAARAHRRAAILDDTGLRANGSSKVQQHLVVGWQLAEQGRLDEALGEYRAARSMCLPGESAREAEEGIERCEAALARAASSRLARSGSERP